LMPIYEFECARCGHRFDRLQKLSDPDPSACPTCAAPEVNRRLSAPSFRLAGSGWYETDFKKGAEKKRNLADKGEAAKEAPKPESKGDGGATKSSDSKTESTKPGAETKAAPKPAPSKPAD
jgi:putative FmdB family regulatory protein